jgi:hypothetical protein
MHIAEPDVESDDVPLPEGEVVSAALPSGMALSLRFASAYEAWLSLDGRRVVEDASAEDRLALMWLQRRMTSLYRALDLHRGLRGRLTSAGVIVTDLVTLDDGVAADHGTLASVLEAAQVRTLDFAALGAAGSRSDLIGRVRGLYAAGTPVEVRVEDQHRVIARRRWRVGR